MAWSWLVLECRDTGKIPGTSCAAAMRKQLMEEKRPLAWFPDSTLIRGNISAELMKAEATSAGHQRWETEKR
jgi:hypothetical protein